MISKGTTHNNGAKLAEYMTTGKQGERAELWQLRGFEAMNIKDAFRNIQIMAGATRCEQPFFHVQVRNREGEKLNRQQWEHAADRIGRMLGLGDQPRAIAFHIDERTGEEHMHVAWSRIDENTLTAKRLPFFKERLKKISRELEAHFALEPVTNKREGNIKYAPTRAEHEQARRLGLDVHEVRNTIRACYERSDCGASFQAALEHEGMILAQGEKRDFVVIDREGGIHALGKRILDHTAAKIRGRLSDLSRDELPSVESARAFLQELGRQETTEPKNREKPEPVWDRDRDDRKWQDAVVNAAIEKEATERKFAEPEQRQERPGSRKEERPREATGDHNPQPLKLRGMSQQLNEIFEQSHGGQAFAAAVEQKGIAFARVTKDEAGRSHRRAEFASAIGNYAQRYREGEIVAVTEPRLEYRRNGEMVEPQRIHKLNPQAAEKFIAALGKETKVQGIDATLAFVNERARKHSGRWDDIRLENATKAKGRATGLAKDSATKGLKIGNSAVRTIGSVLGAASDAFESLLSPANPKPARETERTGRETEQSIDFARYTAEMAREQEFMTAR